MNFCDKVKRALDAGARDEIMRGTTMTDDEKKEFEARTNDMLATVKAQRDSAMDAVVQLEMMAKALQRESVKDKARIAELEKAAASDDAVDQSALKKSANGHAEAANLN